MGVCVCVRERCGEGTRVRVFTGVCPGIGKCARVRGGVSESVCECVGVKARVCVSVHQRESL